MISMERFILKMKFTQIPIVLLAILSLFPAISQAGPAQPNIIYILADDLGWGDLGINGQEKFDTPHLDKLAADGFVFNNHYTGSTVCAPSRCSLMTGKHTGHATIRGNSSLRTKGRVSLLDSDVTIAELLKEAGYATGASGKWGMGEANTDGAPWKQGFDYWFGYLNQRNAHAYYPPFLYENEEKVVLEGNLDGKRKQYSQDLIMDRALQFVRDHEEGPFFLYLPVTIPHAELHLPDSLLEGFKGLFEEQPFVAKESSTYGSQDYPHAAFAAMVTKLDSDVGKLRTLLSELGLTEKTVILFASDNGPHHEGGGDPPFFDSSGPFRGIKRDLYDGGIHTPFFVTWPETIKSGQSSDHISAFWDVLPTIAELAGASVPVDTDGISFANELFGREQAKHTHLYWEFIFKQEARQAVRFGDWKGVRYGIDSPVEIYDLKADPGETTDLAPLNPDMALKAMMLFDSSHKESPDFPLN